jgi:hypothetical protein
VLATSGTIDVTTGKVDVTAGSAVDTTKDVDGVEAAADESKFELEAKGRAVAGIAGNVSPGQ